jgi:hypothetical protein
MAAHGRLRKSLRPHSTGIQGIANAFAHGDMLRAEWRRGARARGKEAMIETLKAGMHSSRALLSLIALMAAAGCQQSGSSAGGAAPDIAYDPNSPGGRIVESLLVTDAASYVSGGPAAVRITNRTGRSVGYNLCRSRLERRGDDDVWRQTMGSLAEACTAELRTLRPGQSATYSFRIATTSRPGQYRISTDLEDLQARLRFIAVSNTFSLAGAGD